MSLVIEEQSDRTVLEMTVAEALEVIANLIESVRGCAQQPHYATSVTAIEQVRAAHGKTLKHLPSSLTLLVVNKH